VQQALSPLLQQEEMAVFLQEQQPLQLLSLSSAVGAAPLALEKEPLPQG